MTTPALVPITPKDAWQKVATAITKGRFIIKDSGPSVYYYTYVDTGDPAPVTTPIGNGINKDIEFNSPRTVVNIGDDQVFLAKDGVRLLSRTQFDKIEFIWASPPCQAYSIGTKLARNKGTVRIESRKCHRTG